MQSAKAAKARKSRKPLTPQQQERKRQWYVENAEKVREMRRRWRARNVEKARQYNRDYNARLQDDPEVWKKTLEKRSTKARGWYARDIEKRRKARYDWYRRNTEKECARNRALAAKKKSITTVRSSPEDTYRMISKAVPPGLQRHDRDDLIGTLCLAVLEGKLLVKNVKTEMAKYLVGQNRQNDHHRTLSLDETMPGGKGAWVDHLTEEDLPW